MRERGARRIWSPMGSPILRTTTSRNGCLWKECGERCPYTGDKIGFDRSLRRQSASSRSSTSGRARNRSIILCATRRCADKDVNLDQGQPHSLRVFQGAARRLASGKRPYLGNEPVRAASDAHGKAKRFCAEAMPDEFASRQLNDTGYAASQAMAFLKRLWPDVGLRAPVTVQAVTGARDRATSRRWHLNHILADDGEKTRADHRHHAIDALSRRLRARRLTRTSCRTTLKWQRISPGARRRSPTSDRRSALAIDPRGCRTRGQGNRRLASRAQEGLRAAAPGDDYGDTGA